VDDVERAVAERLRAGGIAAEVRDTAPNLEDVFVAATRRPRDAAERLPDARSPGAGT
jgi:hypothetical protein